MILLAVPRQHKETNIGAVSKTTLGKRLRNVLERVWAFPSAYIPSWTELNRQLHTVNLYALSCAEGRLMVVSIRMTYVRQSISPTLASAGVVHSVCIIYCVYFRFVVWVFVCSLSIGLLCLRCCPRGMPGSSDSGTPSL